MGETLADVYDAYRTDHRFKHLRTEGIVLVPGDGPSRPKVLICGEAPGATENTTQRPFTGASGQVLRSLIKDVAQLPDEDYFITNIVKYRPPLNRTPTLLEVADSLPYLRREWACLGRPRVLVAVGGSAKQAIAPDVKGVLENSGKPIRSTAGRTIWVMIHPAYGLRSARIRPLMEEHWDRFGTWLREQPWT